MDTLSLYFRRKKGYARMKDLKQAGFHPRTIALALDTNKIEKIKAGCYKLVDYPWDENAGFTDVCAVNAKAVICLTSAAEYYGLTTFNPSEISVAIPHSAASPVIIYPPVKFYFFPGLYYETGITTIRTVSGSFKIYSKEKTIVDLFRYRKKIGEDIVLESLKNYLLENKQKSSKLLQCSEQFGMMNSMLPYVKAMVL